MAGSFSNLVGVCVRVCARALVRDSQFVTAFCFQPDDKYGALIKVEASTQIVVDRERSGFRRSELELIIMVNVNNIL